MWVFNDYYYYYVTSTNNYNKSEVKVAIYEINTDWMDNKSVVQIGPVLCNNHIKKSFFGKNCNNNNNN